MSNIYRSFGKQDTDRTPTHEDDDASRSVDPGIRRVTPCNIYMARVSNCAKKSLCVAMGWSMKGPVAGGEQFTQEIVILPKRHVE